MLSIMHNHLHVISSCRVLTQDLKSKNLDIVNKRTFSCNIHLQPLFLLKESIYKNHLEFSQIKDHLQRPIYPLSPVSYWPTKPSSVLAHQAQFCLAHQAQFRTGPSSPVLYWSTQPSFVLVHQAQIRIAPPMEWSLIFLCLQQDPLQWNGHCFLSLHQDPLQWNGH